MCGDLQKNLATMQTARQGVEAQTCCLVGACLKACVARGGTDDELRVSTQTLAQAIADYKKDAKTAKGLESSAKPKAPKAKKGESQVEATPQKGS